MNQTAGATNAYRRCSKGGKRKDGEGWSQDEDEGLWKQS